MRSKFTRDLLLVAAFDILSKLIVGITSILLIRLLSVSLYASYVKFNAISSLILGIIGTSMATIYARSGTEYLSRGKNYLKQIYYICLFIIVLISVLLGIFSRTIAGIYSVAPSIVLLAFLYGLVQALNKIGQSYFQVKEEYAKAGLLENIKNMLQFLMLGAFLVFAIPICENALFAVFILSSLFPVTLGSMALYWREKTVKVALSDFGILRIIIKESSILVVYMLLLNIIDQTDILLINYMLDDHAVASYGVALKYYQLLLTLQASLITVFGIRTSNKDMVDDPVKRIEFSYKWLQQTWKFILAIFITANVVATPVMNLLNGKEYADSIMAFRVFILGAAISYLFAPNAAIMMSAKRYDLLCLYAAIGLMINAVIDVLFIPHWGIVAAALATVAGNAFLNIISFVTIQKGKEN